MKKLIIFCLILISLFTFGCSKTDDSSIVKLNRVDISALSNNKLKNIIYSDDLKQGVYKITTSSNTYIFFYGDSNEFVDIGCSLDGDFLNINSNLGELSSDTPSRKLFVIYEKNSTASGNKEKYYENINLFIDDTKTDFKALYEL